MMKLYMKQAWVMLKQNKLFSALYMAGTALAIAMTMAVFVAHYIKIAPIYPETNRMNTWALKTVSAVEGKQMQNWNVSYDLLRDWWYPIRSAEAVTGVFASRAKRNVQLEPGKPEIVVRATFTDPAFFQVFDFTFLNGKPFTQADHDSGLRRAVIGENLAIQLFGTTKAEGRTFSLGYKECRVTGVVRNASNLTPSTYGDLYLPYTTEPGYQNPSSFTHNLTGPFWVYFRVKDAAHGAALEAEAEELVRKYNTSQDKVRCALHGPEPAWKNAYRGQWGALDGRAMVLKWIGIVFVFLLVPALNLSGMISSRMETRLPEMGISKAFGASKGRLLRQILSENLILTCLGGLIGLCLAWVVIIFGSNWVFGLIDSVSSLYTGTKDVSLQMDMLFNPWIFIAAFVVCLFLNILSALIPAWRALRKDIVYSLYQKK